MRGIEERIVGTFVGRPLIPRFQNFLIFGQAEVVPLNLFGIAEESGGKSACESGFTQTFRTAEQDGLRDSLVCDHLSQRLRHAGIAIETRKGRVRQAFSFFFPACAYSLETIGLTTSQTRLATTAGSPAPSIKRNRSGSARAIFGRRWPTSYENPEIGCQSAPHSLSRSLPGFDGSRVRDLLEYLGRMQTVRSGSKEPTATR